jgi:hypothetical protein
MLQAVAGLYQILRKQLFVTSIGIDGSPLCIRANKLEELMPSECAQIPFINKSTSVFVNLPE